jgi:hypothetical protein
MALATTRAPVTNASTTPVPRPVEYVVILAVSLPLTRQEFNSSEQLKFKQSVARTAGVSSDDVSIDRIVDVNSSLPVLRRLLTTGIRVDTSIKAPNEPTAIAISTSLTTNSLNSVLVAEGLPAAAILEPERESGGSSTNTIYVSMASARQVTTTPVSVPPVPVIEEVKSESDANLGAIIGGVVAGITACICILCFCLYTLLPASKDTRI